jgi:hypothetical protein
VQEHRKIQIYTHIKHSDQDKVRRCIMHDWYSKDWASAVHLFSKRLLGASVMLWRYHSPEKTNTLYLKFGYCFLIRWTIKLKHQGKPNDWVESARLVSHIHAS